VPVLVDRLNGKTRRAQIFVAVLSASNFTYAEASWTQGLGDRIGAHTRGLAAIGCAPKLCSDIAISDRNRLPSCFCSA
jgi:transposase